MEGNSVVSVADFMQHLQENNLVIIPKNELNTSQVSFEMMRKLLMKNTNLTFKQVLDHKLLPLTSKQGIESWITRSKIKKDEVFTDKDGKRRILTSAIRRLGYVD